MRIIILLSLFLLPVSAFAHGFEVKPQISAGETFSYIFQIDPLFPVVGRKLHIDVMIADLSEDEPVSFTNLNVEGEVHVGEEVIPLVFEVSEDHYEAVIIPREAGTYTFHITTKDEGLEQSFVVEVDEFGTSGTLRLFVIVLLAFLISIAAYSDCRSKTLQLPYEPKTK